MRDLIEIAYKCQSKSSIACLKCKYYNECILSEILDVHTGNAPTNNRLSNTNPNYICWWRMKMKRIRAPTIRK